MAAVWSGSCSCRARQSPPPYHAELRAMLYGAMVPRGNGATQ